ncbi:acyltransferase family protein [Lichenibacterium dinghuense]|uniref:acyltransferase family protein n=1 Tax=Lichenibacterium dinghuense TaxID=2895977 RepID=UPI001F001D8D|nr:acyltransferase family protein [Lichenibacterium sp. 6Y81]
MASILVGGSLAFAAATAVGAAAARAGFPLPPGERRIGCVDGLRGYLALAVLVHHFVVWMQVTRLGGTWSAPGVALLNNLGAGGVALFFMTTGLVFYPRILRGFRATPWPSVAVTRVFRIVPLVAVSVAVVAAVIVLRTGARPGAGDLGAALDWITARAQPPLLGDPDSGRIDAYVLWSLHFEWIFYVAVLPACALAMDAARGRAPSWAVPGALFCAALLARQIHPQDLPRYLPLFALGMLAHELQRSAAAARWLRGRLATAAAAAALVLGLTTAPDPYGLPQMALLGFFFAAVAAGNGFGGLLRTRGALALGECSYGIYLLHGIVLSLLFVEGAGLLRGIPTGWLPLVAPAAAVAVAGITPLTYLAVERPMIAAGSRLARGLTRRRVFAAPLQAEVAP